MENMTWEQYADCLLEQNKRIHSYIKTNKRLTRKTYIPSDVISLLLEKQKIRVIAYVNGQCVYGRNFETQI